MSNTVIEEKPVNPKADEWAERIAAQQRSGMSVKQFCKDRGLTEYSFYAWRKRLQESGPVRFALVEKSARRQEHTAEPALELVFSELYIRQAFLRGPLHRTRRGARNVVVSEALRLPCLGDVLVGGPPEAQPGRFRCFCRFTVRKQP